MRQENRHYFLTANPMSEDRLSIREDNGLVERLQQVLPEKMNAVFVASDPMSHEEMQFFADEVRACFEHSGFSFSNCTLLDSQNENEAEALIRDASLLLFLGGHVPTQNTFLQKLHMRELLADSKAVMMGFSAGSMNMADTVYSIPELEGEAVDPDYRRFLTGLGVTKTNVIPHYQYLKTVILDGQKMIEEIAFSDSYGRELIGIPDGSFIEGDGETERIFGEYVRIRDGKIE